MGIARCEILSDCSEKSFWEWQQQAPDGSGLRNEWGEERGERECGPSLGKLGCEGRRELEGQAGSEACSFVFFVFKDGKFMNFRKTSRKQRLGRWVWLTRDNENFLVLKLKRAL